ncbi:hypothetical protein CHBEV_333 [Choristoneura biennis entomopoxvirus]|uniref:Uncharacterized protein n=1 Tax=Choristoneura biennis entomopoxvirus TaxID=10288 RepID=A0A916KQ03_CBEPV|nr:hypothetical protein CHBEV_002 [Choristoneura biennis entomopoxvirus]YP_008004403.1 hypothetical protein CHBEV_333 [Choristoneura biennis entomopoxvirus]CCU55570.1 hypothetical protein CHBEV_002 [Choristoneura biennis entomopoxvirus]CCU55901.1 hypothetical protein CHBEV_333 [Choristoneura biennis entomopoxvirus]
MVAGIFRPLFFFRNLSLTLKSCYNYINKYKIHFQCLLMCNYSNYNQHNYPFQIIYNNKYI